MIDYLIDTNVLFAIFKGDTEVKQFVETLACGIDSTVYVESIQDSKSNREKQLIKNYTANGHKLNIFNAKEQRSKEA